jgi:hypothetical protein
MGPTGGRGRRGTGGQRLFRGHWSNVNQHTIRRERLRAHNDWLDHSEIGIGGTAGARAAAVDQAHTPRRDAKQRAAEPIVTAATNTSAATATATVLISQRRLFDDRMAQEQYCDRLGIHPSASASAVTHVDVVEKLDRQLGRVNA